MRKLALASLLCATLGAGAAHAQDFQFVINQSQSNWNWSGTTSLGPLLGNPSTAFQLAGTFGMDLSGGGSPVGAGQIVGANAAVVPDLHGLVPNPIPGFPPLATVDVTGMTFDYSTNAFTVGGGGGFTATWTVTILTGTLHVTPLTGGSTTTDLSGIVGDPTPNPGTITQAGATITLNSTQSSTITFTDPASGITGTLTIAGTLRGSFDCPTPSNYCSTSPNSAGPGAVMSSAGSASVTANDLTLLATGAPNGQNGIFYFGPNQIQVPFGDGFRCVGGTTVRLGVVNSGPTGTFTKTIDNTNLPGTASISAGDRWNFQCWYRDPGFGTAGFNLSDGRSIFFCP
jgi:hypothetical protein